MQPVPQFEEDPNLDVNEPIDPIKTVAEIRAVMSMLSNLCCDYTCYLYNLINLFIF